MTILLICGSRDASPQMLRVAAAAVSRAHAHGWRILCGDASGVDHAVIMTCCKLGVPFAFYGITKQPRHFCCEHHAAEDYHRVPGGYLDRDKFMAEAADRCFGICRKRSSGTMFTCQYARSLKKQVDIQHYE
jgi:hypothetical protein